MNYLLDEQLHETAARALDALGNPDGDAFTHILDHTEAGMADEEIPGLCATVGASVLVTANVKDFGARKRYYEALLEAGIHVVVIRPGKIKFYPAQQVGLLSMHYLRIGTLLAAAPGPSLVRVTGSSAELRSLDDLLAEFEAGKMP